MSPVGVLVRAGVRAAWRSWAFSLPFASMAVLFVAAIDLLGAHYFLAPADALSARPAPGAALAVMLYAISLLSMGLYLNIFTSQPLIREKAQGLLESLLATPLGVRELWLARALAVYLPALVLGELLGGLSLLALGSWLALRGGALPLTLWSLLAGFVVVPLVYLALCLLVLLVGLIGNPVAGNVLAQVALPLMASVMINLAARGVLPATEWPFVAIHLGLAGALLVAVRVLLPRLTREQVVVSRSRG